LRRVRSPFGPSELFAIARRVVQGDVNAALGVTIDRGTEYEDVTAAWLTQWGWDASVSAPARIESECTGRGYGDALTRIASVAAAGGRVAFATARPASLFALHLGLAATVVQAGGTVVTDRSGGRFHDQGRRNLGLTWIGGVALVANGADLVATSGLEAADEWCFRLPRVDLVVADGAFAGRAVADGYETVAFADLDGVAFACTTPRAPLHLVPIPERAAPASYEGLVAQAREELLATTASPATFDNSRHPS